MVSAKGAINASGHDALATPSPISDNSIVPAFGTPANANYRGLATVQTGLQKLLTGRGLKPDQRPAKTYPHLLAWIGKHYKGDAADRPMFSRAQPADLAQAPSKDPAERAQQIINILVSTPAPLERVAQTISRATGLEHAAKVAYDKGEQRDFS